MIVKRFGCTTIHNKALYKCFIHSFIIVVLSSTNLPRQSPRTCIVLGNKHDSDSDNSPNENSVIVYSLKLFQTFHTMGEKKKTIWKSKATVTVHTAGRNEEHGDEDKLNNSLS